MSTITGRISSKHNPITEIQRLPIPLRDTQKRGLFRLRDAFRRPNRALTEADLSGLEQHILETTKGAYRL